MKMQLAVLATLALMGSFAAAQDKGTEFKFGGEVEQRYENNQAANFTNAAQSSDFLSRNQFHVNAISSDKLQAYFDFIHTAIWGAGNNIPTNQYPYSQNQFAAVPTGANEGLTNALQVSEAWLWWKVSDMLSIRSGRQALDYGDGLVFSKNDWLATPYNADGMMARLSWDFLDLDFGGGVLANLGNNTATGLVAPGANTPGAVTLTPSGTDTETVFYGFYASFKTLPDVVKKAELFAITVNEDGGLAPSSFLPGYTFSGGAMNLTAVGIHVKGDVSLIDYRVDGVYEFGKQKAGGVLLASDATFNANMEDIEVGANFPEFMKGRIFVNYHRDTGNDSSDQTQRHDYQPLFYDRHTYAGLMDTFGFGNLTDVRIGLSVTPIEDTTVGIEANLLSRTSTNVTAGASWLGAGDGNLFGTEPGAAGIQPGQVATTNRSAGDSGLGTEYGIWATHNYGHGFSMYAQLGFLSVGNYYKNATPNLNIGSPMQFIAQAKYGF